MKSTAVRLLLATLFAASYLHAADDDPAPNDSLPIRERLKRRVAKPSLPTKQGTETRTLTHDGQSRSYQLRIPAKKGADSRLPLVIVLHGALANGRITEALTGFSPLADKQGFAVVYPDADPKGGLGAWDFWQSRRPNAKDAAPGAKTVGVGRDDIGFLAAMIDELVTAGIVDRRRVYATGISNGGFMSNRLGYELPDRIAAIAPVAGTMVKALSDNARPPRTLPVLYIHGTADKIVGIDGTDFLTKGRFSQSAEELVAWWAKQNGCATAPRVEMLPDTSKTDGTTVERRTFAAGPSGAPVIYYQIIGGGHTWPGGSFQPEFMLGKTSRDMDASHVIWDFFSQHKLP